MTNIRTLEKCIAKYGDIEYSQIPDTDDTAWREITDLPLFCKMIFISSKKIDKRVLGIEDYNDTLEKLEKNFLQECHSEVYEITYCTPSKETDFPTDPIFIRLHWVASRKEIHRKKLIHSFIALSYFYLINTEAPDSQPEITKIISSLDEDWVDIIKYSYAKYARGTYGGTHHLKDQCARIKMFTENVSHVISGSLHPKA